MAATHYVQVSLIRVGPDGSPISQQEPIKHHLEIDLEQRIIPDTSVPNSANYPTISDYLTAEATSGFQPVQVGQTFIVTYQP